MNTQKISQFSEIDEFIESYWPLSRVAREFHELVTSGWEAISYEEFEDKVKQYELRYDEELCELFGNDLVAPYLALRGEFLTSYSEGAFQELTEYTMKIGIDEYVPFSYLVRSRATLQMLLEAFSDEKPFTLIDCGAGNGKITAGLVAYLPNIEKVYAIDINPHAAKQIKRHFDEAGSLVHRNITSKLEVMTRDYRDPALISSLPLRIADVPTIALASHLTQYDEVIPLLNRLIPLNRFNNKARIVIDLDFMLSQDDMMVSMSLGEYGQEILSESLPDVNYTIDMLTTRSYFAQKEIGLYRFANKIEDL